MTSTNNNTAEPLQAPKSPKAEHLNDKTPQDNSSNEAESDLYNDAMEELMMQILNFQQEQLLIYHHHR